MDRCGTRVWMPQADGLGGLLELVQLELQRQLAPLLRRLVGHQRVRAAGDELVSLPARSVMLKVRPKVS